MLFYFRTRILGDYINISKKLYILQKIHLLKRVIILKKVVLMKKVFRGTLLSRFLAISVLMIFLLSNIVSASILDLMKNKGNNLITGMAEGETAPAESSPPPAPEPAPSPPPEPSPAPEPSPSPSPEPAPSSDGGDSSLGSDNSQPSESNDQPHDEPTSGTEPAPSPDTQPTPPTEERRDDSTQPSPPSDQQCPQVSCNCPNGCEIRDGCLTSSCLQIDEDLMKEHEDDFREIDDQRKKDDFEKRKKEEYDKYQQRLGKERGGDRRDDRRDNRGGNGDFRGNGPSAEDMKRMQQENERRRQEEQEMMKEGQSMRSESMQNWMEDIEFKLEEIESQGVDVSEGRKYVDDAKDLLRKASSASDQRESEKLFREAERKMMGFQKLEMKLRQESDKLRMLEEVENVMFEIENFMSFVEEEIADAKELGADVSEAEKLLDEVKDTVTALQKMKDSKEFDRRAFMKNMNFLRRVHPKMEKVMRELRAVSEVRRIIEEIEYHFEDFEQALADFKASGIDTSEADKLLEEGKSNLQKVVELYKSGKAQQAFTILRKMEPLGRKAERLMRQYSKEMDSSGRRGEFGRDQIEDVLDEAFTRIPLAEGKINEFADEGIDTSDAEELLGKIKGIMFKAKELYKDGANEDAMDVAKQAFPYANKLEKLFSKYRKKNLGIDEFRSLELVGSAKVEDLDSSAGSGEGSMLETDKVSALKNTVQKIRAEIKQVLNAADNNLPTAESKIKEFKAAGADVSKAEELLVKIKKIVNDAKEKFASNDFVSSLEKVEEAYPLADKLESEFGRFEKKRTKDDVKSEVEAVLLKAKNRLPSVRDSLKAFKEESIDVSKSEELLGAIEKLVEDAESKYEDGDYKAALKILQRAFPLGGEIERLFDSYNKNRKDDTKIKQQLDAIYKEADTQMPEVEKTFGTLASKGVNVEEGKAQLNELKKILATSQSLYQQNKFKEALVIIKKAESSEVELSHKITQYFSELESGKKEKLSADVQVQKDESLLAKIGFKKEEKDKYDQFDDDFKKFEDEVDIKLPDDRNRFEDDEFDDRGYDEGSRDDERDFGNDRMGGGFDDRGMGDDRMMDDRRFDDRRGSDQGFDDREFGDNRDFGGDMRDDRGFDDRRGPDSGFDSGRMPARREGPRDFGDEFDERFEKEASERFEKQATETERNIREKEFNQGFDRMSDDERRNIEQKEYERIKEEKTRQIEQEIRQQRTEEMQRSQDFGSGSVTLPR